MKNPYIFGYLPFVTIVLFSLAFGVYTVGMLIDLFKGIGLYAGMREFLTDMQLRGFLLIVVTLMYFMVFAALKLIAETIHEISMLFFSTDTEGHAYLQARGGTLIYFFGALVTAGGIHSIKLLLGIFLMTTFIYFIYVMYILSKSMSMINTFGLLFFEIFIWGILVSGIVYILLKLYNGVIASLPFVREQ